ncbi:glycoside hydrolase family 25 protein [Rhizobium sp. NXC24]|uniref:glycoside hydrolase family 25 protein n=1 Tax=Rhizobium sp. NXC24 TaxID=2048897 RepID=UPI000CDF56AA|nr:glycoside hydrolase family 25 protein [Rhizobium sp. NXC24]AVA21293.1 cell wall glycoside hydrolase family 25 protein [Rhizobium sp. NXC24]
MASASISNSVIDISHHNGTRLRFDRAKEGGVLGVIHKATQGELYVDPTLVANRQRILDTGLLFGAYHFGTGANGVSQAAHFLDVVQPTEKTLLVLDFEDNPTGGSMSLEEARAFVTHVKAATGRWPGFYSGHTIKRALGVASDPVLANCWFWLAQYGPTPVVPPCWTTWTLWQYTDGAVGEAPHEVDGIGRCDRNNFQGTEEALSTWWGR